jgi:hypothetical protein
MPEILHYKCEVCEVETTSRATETLWISIDGAMHIYRAGLGEVETSGIVHFNSLECLSTWLAGRLQS